MLLVQYILKLVNLIDVQLNPNKYIDLIEYK